LRSALDGLIELHNVDYKAALTLRIFCQKVKVITQTTNFGDGLGRYQKAKTWNVPAVKKVNGLACSNIPSKEKNLHYPQRLSL